MDTFRMGLTIRTVDLVRSWLGQALRATGAAVVVPVAIILALSLTALGGSGLSGLGALSQVVSGPRAAGSDLTVDNGDSEIGSAVSQLAAGGPGAAVPPGAPDTLTGPGPGGGGGGGGETPGGTPTPPGDGEGPGGGTPTPPGGGGGETPAPPAAPAPGQPGVVDGLGETVTDVTGGTPVGPTVEDAVDGLLDVCGRLGCP
jgi:hypothetical protein